MENVEHERLKLGFYQRASTITSTNATNRDDPGENKIRRKPQAEEKPFETSAISEKCSNDR